MQHTPRSSSLVKNLNSLLRIYFTLRRHLGTPYLHLLCFFMNHRRFIRSRRAEHQGKSLRELVTGQNLPRTGSRSWALARFSRSEADAGRSTTFSYVALLMNPALTGGMMTLSFVRIGVRTIAGKDGSRECRMPD
jgi:hypothetical protein